MGIEYMVVCMRCNTFCDIHKLDPCESHYTSEGDYYVSPQSMCGHDEDECMYQRRKIKFHFFEERMRKFFKIHDEYKHHPIIISDSDDMHDWILFESDWEMFEPTKHDVEWLNGLRPVEAN